MAVVKIRTVFFDMVKIVWLMVNFWQFFLMKNTNFDFKVIPMYQYSIFSKSDVYFIRFIHYKQVFFYRKITAVVLPAAEHLNFRGSIQPSLYIGANLKKKLQNNFCVYLKICTIIPLVTFYKNVFFFRKIFTIFLPKSHLTVSSAAVF